MREHHRTGLHDEARSTCPHCGAAVWLYESPMRVPVLLDEEVGPYVLDAKQKAYRSANLIGYQGHLEHCPASPLVGDPASGVSAAHFLWL